MSKKSEPQLPAGTVVRIGRAQRDWTVLQHTKDSNAVLIESTDGTYSVRHVGRGDLRVVTDPTPGTPPEPVIAE